MTFTAHISLYEFGKNMQHFRDTEKRGGGEKEGPSSSLFADSTPHVPTTAVASTPPSLLLLQSLLRLALLSLWLRLQPTH